MQQVKDGVCGFDHQSGEIAPAMAADAELWHEHLGNALATLARCRRHFQTLSVAREPAELAEYVERLSHRIETLAKEGIAGSATPLPDGSEMTSSDNRRQEWLGGGSAGINESLPGDSGAIAQSP